MFLTFHKLLAYTHALHVTELVWHYNIHELIAFLLVHVSFNCFQIARIALDEYDSNSVLLRTCEESVAVNKCEGACASSIKPSAIVPGGFQKVFIMVEAVVIASYQHSYTERYKLEGHDALKHRCSKAHIYACFLCCTLLSTLTSP
jgi:hypothetical protein